MHPGLPYGPFSALPQMERSPNISWLFHCRIICEWDPCEGKGGSRREKRHQGELEHEKSLTVDLSPRAQAVPSAHSCTGKII